MFASVRKCAGIDDVGEISLAAKEQLFSLFEKQAGFGCRLESCLAWFKICRFRVTHAR
jgi:hypothetical protein